MMQQEQRPDYQRRQANYNPKFMKQKIEIISSDEYPKVMDRFYRFANFIKAYGAQIHGTPFSTCANTVDGIPFVTYSICICYEIAETVTPEMMQRAYQK